MAFNTARRCAVASRDKTFWRRRNRVGRPRSVICLLVVLNEGEDVDAVQFFAAVEEGELDGEGGAFDDASELLDELDGGGGGATGGEKIVADDDALAMLYGVFVNLERVRAVLERVGDAGGFGGEFFRLSNRDESCAKT